MYELETYMKNSLKNDMEFYLTSMSGCDYDDDTASHTADVNVKES